jgi:C1A family cysteine protease
MPSTTSKLVDVLETVVVVAVVDDVERWKIVAVAVPAVLILAASAVAAELVRPGRTAANFAPVALIENPVKLAAVNLSIWLCAAAFVVKIPPTTSQSFVVEVFDDADVGGATVVVGTVAGTLGKVTITEGDVAALWPVVRFGCRTGVLPLSGVVDELLLAAAHADVASASDIALTRKAFDFGIGPPRAVGRSPLRQRHRSRDPQARTWQCAFVRFLGATTPSRITRAVDRLCLTSRVQRSPRTRAVTAFCFVNRTESHVELKGRAMENALLFGWKPDLPDHRDLMFSARLDVLRQLPAKVDLRPKCPPVYDQLQLGSCTANAIGGAIQFGRKKAKQAPDFVPSRLFIYYNERDFEHTIRTDAGARIRDGIRTVSKFGVCDEKEWLYSDTGHPEQENGPFASGAPAAKKPPAKAYHDAMKFQVTSYMRLSQTLSQLKGCLADGYPFIFGFTVFANFFGPDGKPRIHTPMPSGERLGGHAVMAVGYDDARGEFIVRNSWGTKLLDKGYYYMRYSYVTSSTLASDLWTIRTIEA